MVRSKNKPKKNATAASPAAIPTGTTEVIVPTPASTSTLVPASATTNPTFTQIGMAGMIGMIGATAIVEEPKVEQKVKAEEPKAEEPKAEEPKAEEPKAEEPKAEEPKAEESIAAASIPESNGGIFGFFRRFYNSLGGAIHR